MTEPIITGEGAKAGDGAAAPAIDMSKYVSKEDHDTAVSEGTDSQKKLQDELDQAKLSLLDPEYISYLESKKAPKPDAPAAKELDEMTSAELRDSLKSELVEPLREELNKTKATLTDVLAVLELQEVAKRRPDFANYREDVQKIIETSQTPLTFEQAYLIAKANAPEKAGKAADGTLLPAPAKGTEKPTGTVPGETVVKKDFTSAEEAADDAWDKVVGPGKDTL